MSKILHIIPSLKFGGEERFLLDIYPFLNKNVDHKICPFLHDGELYHHALNLERYQNNHFWLSIFRSKKKFTKILKPYVLFFYYAYRAHTIIRSENPDIVISYTVQAAIAVYVAHFFSWKQSFFWCARVGNQMDHPALLQKFFRAPFIYRYTKIFINAILKKVFSKANSIIAVNSFLIKRTSDTYNLNVDKFFFLPCCLPIKDNHYYYNSCAFSTGDYIITIGRLEYQKGFDFLIKTFSHFVRDYPTIKLLIVGEGSQRKELEKLIFEYALMEKVFLLGFMKNPEQLIPASLICVVPSRTEGFCKVVIEAMAKRSIVIASNCDFGPREIITNGIDGILFESENNASLLSAMHNVIHMSEKNKIQLKDNAYQRAQDYTPEHVAATLNQHLELIYDKYSNIPSENIL